MSSFATKELTFNKGYDSLYVYDFVGKTQKNCDSGRVRKIRRVERGVASEDEGFVAMIKEVSSAGPAHPVATAKPAMPSIPAEWADEIAAAAAAGKAASGLPAGVAPEEGKAGGVAHDDADTDEDEPPAKKKKPDPAEDSGKAVSKSSGVPPVPDAVVALQVVLGAQSRRKQPYALGAVGHDPHGKYCFDRMLSREKQLCGELAVFYHSYSFAALLYEVQAAVAAVLFRFKSEYATLPRLLKAPYKDLPDAESLIKLFPSMPSRDHDPRFRAVAISGTSSLLAEDSEAPPKSIFLHGYSCMDVCFFGVLENLLVSCGVPEHSKNDMAKKIVALSGSHGLDVSQFKGKPCKSGRAGHMLQIFVKRTIVSTYVYGAMPYGVPDGSRKDLAKYLEGDGPIQGQVRIVTNPSAFMRGNAVRMYVYSADPSFHANRPAFQKELTDLLHPVIGTKEVRTKAAEGIYGGKVPEWFNPTDYEERKDG